MNKKKHTKFIKSTNISLLFRIFSEEEILVLFINFVCFFYSCIFERTHLKLAFLMYINIYKYIYHTIHTIHTIYIYEYVKNDGFLFISYILI